MARGAGGTLGLVPVLHRERSDLLPNRRPVGVSLRPDFGEVGPSIPMLRTRVALHRGKGQTALPLERSVPLKLNTGWNALRHKLPDFWFEAPASQQSCGLHDYLLGIRWPGIAGGRQP